jgi:hypothetical protein
MACDPVSVSVSLLFDHIRYKGYVEVFVDGFV